MVVRRISECESIPSGYQIYSRDYLTRTSLAAPYGIAWVLRGLKLLREKTIMMRPTALEKVVQEAHRKGVERAHEERKPKNPYTAGQSIEVKG